MRSRQRRHALERLAEIEELVASLKNFIQKLEDEDYEEL